MTYVLFKFPLYLYRLNDLLHRWNYIIRHLNVISVVLIAIPIFLFQFLFWYIIGRKISLPGFRSIALFRYVIGNREYIHKKPVCNINTTVCPPVRGDKPRALATGLSPIQAGKPWYNYFTPPSLVYTLYSMKYSSLLLDISGKVV